MELAELDKEFNRRVQEKQNWYNGGYARDVQSNLTPPEVFGFIEEQDAAQQEAAESRGFGTAVLNGLKSGVRGVLGAAKGAIDSNIAEHKKNDPNYRPVNDWAYGVTESLQSGIDSLQREEIKADSAAGQLMYDLTEGAVQLAMQAAVTAATGGTAGAIYMGTTIAGDQYLELRKEGVDAERAMQASLMNAPFQAALEKIGMGKIMSKLPAGSGLRKKLGEVLKAGFEEGITEGLQELPEQFTNIWAKDKNATAESMLAKWGENWEQNVKEAGYSALLGSILGGSAKELHIITNSVGRKVSEKITEVKKEQLVADAERVANSGINPEYAAALIDANSQGETVTVQAADLNALKQQTNGAKLVETLGVTDEQIEQAAENGQDIDISKGRFIAAMVENKGLYEATKDGMFFDINGDLSTNAAENLKTLRADTKVSEEQMQRLDLEVKNVVDSAIAAGMNKAHAENLQLMIESRAIIASPENPAAWLQKNKLRFNNAGKKPTSKRGWLQKAFHGTTTRGIEKLSTDFVGKNATFHGWGLYFGSKKLASAYAENPDYEKRYIVQSRVGKYKGANRDWVNANNGQSLPTDSPIARALSFLTSREDGQTKNQKQILEIAKKELQDEGLPNEQIEKTLKIIKENFNAKSVEDSSNEQGEILKVDIPENENLLNFDKTVKEQSKYIRDILNKLGYEDSLKAEDLYYQIADELGSEKAASLFLNKNGIQGHYVTDLDEGPTYVVYDDNVVKILGKEQLPEHLPENFFADEAEFAKKYEEQQKEYAKKSAERERELGPYEEEIAEALDWLRDHEKNWLKVQNFINDVNFYLASPENGADQYGPSVKTTRNVARELKQLQKDLVAGIDGEYTVATLWRDGWQQNGQTETKGQIRPQEDGSYIIDLFKGADASTVIHETGHYFVDTMINEAALDPSNTRLANDAKILLEYGGMTMEQWKGASLDEKRAAHEKLAEGFETYIMEGKAPSAGLKKAFERFSKWLTAIYSKIARNENAADLTDDVRGVFDRMLASQEEIEMQAQLNGMFNELPSELTNKLPLEAKNALLDKISKAKEKAVDILTREMMKNFNANRRAEKEAYIEEITPKIEEYIHAEKVNQGRDLVAYHFGGEREKNAAAFKDVNGRAHANRPVKVHRDANPSIIARKYRHAIGSVLPNYNDVLNDTKAAINDRLNTIIEDLKNSIVEYNESLRDAWAQGGAEGYWTFEGESIDPTIIKDYVKANGGKYDDNVRAKLERDGYVFHPADEEVSGGNWYRNYVEVNGKKKLSNKEIERIARDIYSGNDYYGYDPEAKMYEGNPEYEAEMQANKAELDELYRLKERLEKTPEGVDLVEMSKRSALSDEQRVLFETIAEEVGYSSGDEMAQDIISKPSERQMVRNFINEAVQARFPDIYAERALAEEKAREALYNDESGEVIALEQQIIESYLNETVGRQESKQERMDMAKAMKQIAEVKAKNIIQRMTVSDITKGNGRKFMLAERRAAANAAKAIKDGDLDAAMEYKRQQLINHELYRQALQIRGQVKSAQRFIRKMANMKKENFGTQQHFNQIAFILERMGIKRRGYDREGDNQFLPAYVEEMREKCGAIVDIPEFVLNESNDISSPDNLLFSQYQDVINAMKNIYAIAKYDTRMSKMSKEQTFAETKRDIMEHLRKLNDVYTPRLGGDRKKGFIKGFADRIKDYRNVLRNADNFYLAMDNWTDGYFTKNWYDTINHCADAEATMTWEYQDKLASALKSWEPDKATAKAHDADVYYEELGTSTDKNTLVTMLCNLGNEGNKNRLCGTPPVAAENSKLWVKESALVSKEQAIEMTRQNLVEFLSKYLTKADVEYAQARINAANAYYPQIRDLNIRTKGFAPPAVEATPMTMKLADGSVVYFKGGYFPLVRDSRKGSAPSGQNRLSATDEYPGSGISTMRTDAASSKGRIGGNYPVKLDRGCEITPIMDTIHDICYREAMMDFRKILNDAEIFAELKAKLGEQNVRLLREQLETCANPYSNKQAAQAEELFSKTADALRRTATNGAIMLNFKTAAQNFSNILLYGNSVEGFTHADAFRAMSRAFSGQGRADVDAICRKSAFMRERMETPDVALNDIKNRNDLNPVERNTLKYGARLLGYTDMMTAKPVFAEAYMKKINEGASEQAAIDFANRVVRRTLGSSRMQDVSSLQRGSRLFRLFTMFQGFFNTQFNQWDREYHIMRNLWNNGEKKEMIERLIAFVSAKFLGACLMNVAIAELSLTAPFEKDKDGYRKISKELLNYPISMGGPIGQFSNVALQNLLGMRNYGYRLTATQGLLDKGLTVARRAGDVVRGEKEASTLFEPTAYTIGAAFGVPGSVFNLIFNGYDIYDGTMDAELADIMSRRPKNERKPEEQLEKEREKY